MISPDTTRRFLLLNSIYTGFVTAPFPEIHKAMEGVMGRPIWTHEIPSLTDEMKARVKDEWIALSKELWNATA